MNTAATAEPLYPPRRPSGRRAIAWLPGSILFTFGQLVLLIALLQR